MTQEEKQLLLKDLCSRLPYGLKFQSYHSECGIEGKGTFDFEIGDDVTLSMLKHWCETDNNKPYLRPMSSMTEKEKEELCKLCNSERVLDEETQEYLYTSYYIHFGSKEEDCEEDETDVNPNLNYSPFDWLNAHHFDYRIDPSTGKTLIESGLALEASEGMYNKEEPEKGSEIPIPKTVDEAVKTLAKIVSKEDRDYLLENGAISMHDSLGRWIRNEWGLWTGSELKDELMNMNKGLNHPDDMSNYIIEEFIKYWNEKGKNI